MNESSRHILELALQLFKAQGVKSVTMDDIAREAGVSKKTIYQHYLNKEDLIVSILLERFEYNREKIQEIMGSDMNPVEKVVHIYDYSLKSIHSYSLSFFRGIRKYHPNAREMCDEYMRNLIFGQIATLLQEAKEQGLIRPETNIKLLSEIYLWGIREFSNGALSEQVTKDFDAFFSHFILNNIRGMLTDEYLSVAKL